MNRPRPALPASRADRRLVVPRHDVLRRVVSWAAVLSALSCLGPGDAARGIDSPSVPPLPKLVIRQTGPKQAIAGGKILLSIELENHGPQVTNLRVTYQYDKQLLPTRATDGWKAEGKDLYWTETSLLSGEKKRYLVECDCLAAGARVTSKATATYREGGPTAATTVVEITEK